MKYCYTCGQVLNDETAVCPYCGADCQAPVSGPSMPYQPSSPYPPQQSPYPPSTPYPSQQQSPYPPQNPYAQNNGYSPYPQNSKGVASTGGVVCGIVGIVFAFLFALVGHVCSIVAICLGIKDLSNNAPPTALILGIIGEVMSIISSVMGVLIVNAFM